MLTVTDIAGLVRGASEGAGLGNAFLSHIAAVDGIYHMVRVFEDDEVTHVEGEAAGHAAAVRTHSSPPCAPFAVPQVRWIPCATWRSSTTSCC